MSESSPIASQWYKRNPWGLEKINENLFSSSGHESEARTYLQTTSETTPREYFPSCTAGMFAPDNKKAGAEIALKQNLLQKLLSTL